MNANGNAIRVNYSEFPCSTTNRFNEYWLHPNLMTFLPVYRLITRTEERSVSNFIVFVLTKYELPAAYRYSYSYAKIALKFRLKRRGQSLCSQLTGWRLSASSECVLPPARGCLLFSGTKPGNGDCESNRRMMARGMGICACMTFTNDKSPNFRWIILFSYWK